MAGLTPVWPSPACPSADLEDDGPGCERPPPTSMRTSCRSSPVLEPPDAPGPGLVAAATGTSSEIIGSSGSLSRWGKPGAVPLASYHMVLAEETTEAAGLWSDSAPALPEPSPWLLESSRDLDRSDPRWGLAPMGEVRPGFLLPFVGVLKWVLSSVSPFRNFWKSRPIGSCRPLGPAGSKREGCIFPSFKARALRLITYRHGNPLPSLQGEVGYGCESRASKERQQCNNAGRKRARKESERQGNPTPCVNPAVSH